MKKEIEKTPKNVTSPKIEKLDSDLYARNDSKIEKLRISISKIRASIPKYGYIEQNKIAYNQIKMLEIKLNKLLHSYEIKFKIGQNFKPNYMTIKAASYREAIKSIGYYFTDIAILSTKETRSNNAEYTRTINNV